MRFVVTPWEVKGEVDYERLIKEFGVEKIDDKILKLFKKYAGELHPYLKRRLFFSHRDLDWLFREYEKGNKFYLYTGRGPSSYTHIGHLVPWIFTKWLQEKFKAKLLFQITDDEKFLFKRELSLEDVKKFAYDNILDIIALGFDRKRTEIFLNTEYSKTLYPLAIKVAKKITFSTAKAVFGFKNDSNIGEIFFTSMQSVPAFLESVRAGKNIPCLIPYAIDQDAHFRVCRDVLPKLGYYKPASIHSKFIPGLGKGGKMSASEPDTAIFVTDAPIEVERKILKAFTGGRDTLKEQKRLGGKPKICTVFAYYSLFETDDKKVQELEKKCKCGEIFCKECKRILIDIINKFLKKHQEKREKAKSKVEKFIVKD